MKPIIFGLSEFRITAAERALFAHAEPAGFILFKRNIADRAQVSALTQDLRALTGQSDLPILIDQEGGRVARLSSPIWPDFPAAARFDALYQMAPMTAIEAARQNAEAMGHTLAELGINVNCMPVLDVRHDATHSAIGDRALGRVPMQVAALGRALLDGLAQAGVAGVLKHMPGQGYATVDSHHDLPRVTLDTAALIDDFEPFRSLAHAPFGMTAHVIFDAWDAERPATLSPHVVTSIIRGLIAFEGLLLSDDITMNALAGPIAARAQACLAAGCDLVLHCSGDEAEMHAISDALDDMPTPRAALLSSTMARYRPHYDADQLAASLAKRDQLLKVAA
jgi:beta-N-acetylhexosaminidase